MEDRRNGSNSNTKYSSAYRVRGDRGCRRPTFSVKVPPKTLNLASYVRLKRRNISSHSPTWSPPPSFDYLSSLITPPPFELLLLESILKTKNLPFSRNNIPPRILYNRRSSVPFRKQPPVPRRREEENKDTFINPTRLLPSQFLLRRDTRAIRQPRNFTLPPNFTRRKKKKKISLHFSLPSDLATSSNIYSAVAKIR